MNTIYGEDYYPACHSMDSDWFAVDKNGNIGFFYTSGEGPLPISFSRQEDVSCPEAFFDYTPEIKGRLHELYLPKPTIQKILNECSEEEASKLLKKIEDEDSVFFEGFILLNEGITWNDLDLQAALDSTNYDFALKVSEKHELYYISDIYDISKVFGKMLKNKAIKSLLDIDISEREHEFFETFYFDHYWNPDTPYEKKYAPKNPLHVSKLNKDILEKAVIFKDAEFSKMGDFFQPLKYISCRTYCPHEKINEDGDAVLIDDDNKTEFICRLSPTYYTYYKTGAHICNICNPEFSRYDFYHKKSVSYTDFPPVFFLQEEHEYEEVSIHWNPTPLMTKLGLKKFDVYIASCVKCTVANCNDPNQNLPMPEQLAIRFKNCFFRLEEELRYLAPVLIVCNSELEFGLLNSIFNITPDSAQKYFYTFECTDLVLPLLYTGACINDVTEEEFSKIKKKIEALCSKPRNVPKFKRIIGKQPL